MKKFFPFVLVCLFTFTVNAEMNVLTIPVNSTQDLDTVLRANCPWIRSENVSKIQVAAVENVGSFGGEVGKLIGKFNKSNDTRLNRTVLRGNIPAGTQALMFDVTYYNNNGLAQVIMNKITIFNSEGQSWVSRDNTVLEQRNSNSMLVCFAAEDTPVHIITEVTSSNVDGSRPKIGISGYQRSQMNVPR